MLEWLWILNIDHMMLLSCYYMRYRTNFHVNFQYYEVNHYRVAMVILSPFEYGLSVYGLVYHEMVLFATGYCTAILPHAGNNDCWRHVSSAREGDKPVETSPSLCDHFRLIVT